ncbi:MAG TPA: VOC family protein [Conexibacter sp.]|nr:VOC family protein [Conexibacter sp.]
MATTAPAISVTGVDFISIPARDLEASARFYGEVLGLQRSKAWQREGSPAMGIEFETGTVTLALIDPAAIGRELASHSMPIALRVDDVAAARAALEERGIVFFGETIDSGVCHMSHFADPDGNVLMLHHRYAPRT